MRKNLVYIGFAFAHHKNSQGGYHHIKEYLKYDTIIDAQWEKEFYESTSTNLFIRIIRRAYIFILGQGTPFSVIRCVLLALFRKNQVFHFVYAENSYKWLHHFIGKTNKIVCTFHQPSNYFLTNPDWLPLIKKIDTIILMTEVDVPIFKEWTGRNNVFFIPHGINCQFYSHNSSIVRNNSILMVGNWLRDFDLAAKVVEKINHEFPDVEINIVTLKANFDIFRSLNVNLFSNITDEELKKMYQTTKVVFFPLKQFTANNSVLEAASCGCQIIISTLGKFDTSYFSNSNICYLNNDPDIILAKIKQLLFEDNRDISIHVRDYAKKNFSWEAIAIITEIILKKV